MPEIKQNPEDISSYSNFNEILQKEVDIDVSLDFDKKKMIGTMDVKYEILTSEIPKIILDLKGPEIVSIEFNKRWRWWRFNSNSFDIWHTGIQFLTKEQIYTKKYPFIFTQCEAIQCRSLFPAKDSPLIQ